MEPIRRDEILPLGDYEQIRPHFRARVIEEKKARRATFGDFFSVSFENRDTVLLQIQEMLRTERITKEDGIQHEMATYNDLLPGADQLSLTMFIEIADKEERERRLEQLAGLDHHVAIEVDGRTFQAESKDRSVPGYTRTTTVHYFKVTLDADAQRALRAGAPVAIVISHPQLSLKSTLPRATVASLASDLETAST